MATPTKCEEKRLEGADPQTGYRARLLGKETYAYTAPGAMDNRDDRATERSGAKEKEEGTSLQEKGRGRKAPSFLVVFGCCFMLIVLNMFGKRIVALELGHELFVTRILS